MAYEEFYHTDYVEVDSAGNIDLEIPNRVGVNTMRRDANSSLYKDFLADHFGEFTHDFEVGISAFSAQYAMGLCYHISNTPAATYEDLLDANVGFAVLWYRPSTTNAPKLYMRQFSNDNETKTTNLLFNTIYYLRVVRDATTIKCFIFSDAARTIEVTTNLTCTFQATPYRYLGVVGSREAPPTNYPIPSTSFYVKNLELNEGAPVYRTLTVNSSNPDSGVAITVSPNDFNGLGNGTTGFNRTYLHNTEVTLTAPPAAGGNNFDKWQRGGVDYSVNLTAMNIMDADYTMTAIYTSPPPEGDLVETFYFGVANP